MTDINYILGTIKILESPKQELLEDTISVTKFKSQLSLSRTTKIINVTFWGNLALDIATYYKIGDYILIEGYISLRNSKFVHFGKLSPKTIELTVLKVYPLYSDKNDSRSTVNDTSNH